MQEEMSTENPLFSIPPCWDVGELWDGEGGAYTKLQEQNNKYIILLYLAQKREVLHADEKKTKSTEVFWLLSKCWSIISLGKWLVVSKCNKGAETIENIIFLFSYYNNL